MALAQLIARFSRTKVVVLGDLVADEYVYGETERVSREAPVLVVRYESSETKLGGAANVAANVAALSGHARPVGAIGRDDAGWSIESRFEELGVSTRGILTTVGRRTETKTRILAGGRSTTRQQMLRVDRAADRPLTSRQHQELRRRLQLASRDANAIVVSDYGSGLIDAPLIEDLRRISTRIPVCVDSRYNIAAFRGLTLAKPNEPELEAAFGGRLRTADDFETAGRKLLATLDVKALVVTRGRLGMNLFAAGRRTLHLPVSGPAEAVDVTGAGDTVLAALAVAIAAGASFEDAARIANVAGGIVVQKPGTATCSRDELKAALSRGRA